MTDVKRFTAIRWLEDDGETERPCHCTVVAAIDHDAEIERLTAELGEANAKQNRWYEVEAKLHGILREVCGDEKYGEAITRLCSPLEQHNPLLSDRPADQPAEGHTLPCDVRVGAVVFRAGCPVRVLQAKLNRDAAFLAELYAKARATDPASEGHDG